METSKTPKPREDQRVRLTKTLLGNAFLELLAQKPVQNVTVKELCERAGVNRGTFYLHYHDVYHLMEEMEAGLVADLDRMLSEMEVITPSATEEATSTFIHSLFAFFEKNRELCAILLGENGDKKFLAVIIERGREKSVAEYRVKYPGASRQKAELFYHFIAWGFIGLLQQSLQGQPSFTFKTAAAAAGQIIQQASRYFET
ncbi:TetR/AcrR family transcriptional regulator [Ruminococcaceae bacterium OttesenSCG-928-D13]|nr:TetR/AcrR family transcriptional regulator [Ruminococcaceae bacterium OttesenSCG-928-D13]